MTQIPEMNEVKKYFEGFIAKFGDSPQGSDWNSDQAQILRYDQLLKIADVSKPFSIIDYGCGYGALADYLEKMGYQFDYYGFDIVEKVIDVARRHHSGKSNRTFVINEGDLPVCDYVVAAGIFNYIPEKSIDSWTQYVVNCLTQFNRLSNNGFSSDFLTKYSDPDRMEKHLYYADPLYLFDYCKRNFSRDVALLHDYHLYDFTILVRKE